MLRLLNSIFGGGEVTAGYPDSLVKQAIERVVDGTDPWLRSVSGYRKKLRPAVIRAIDHVIVLVNNLPPPISIDVHTIGDNPLIKTFFISSIEMRKILVTDHNLSAFLKDASVVPEEIVALLAMEMSENVILGAELSGDIIISDVPQTTVSFDCHRLIDPSADLGETRRLLMRRAFDSLIRFALKRVTQTKAERKYLQRRQALLQSKLAALERGGWGFEAKDPSENTDIPTLEKQIGQIEAQILEIGGDDRILDIYLAIVSDVLGRPEEHLWGKEETLILDNMGIRRNHLSEHARELTFPVLYTSEDRRFVLVLVSLPGKKIYDFKSPLTQ